MADRHGNKVEDIVAEHDEKVREKREREILLTAESLTNGSAGDKTKTGSVLFYLVEESIDQGRVVRAIAETMKDVQFKANCALNHSGAAGKITAFGITFKAPLTALIICAFLLFIYQDQMGRHEAKQRR